MPPSKRASHAQQDIAWISGLHVIEEKASVKNGKIHEYRVTVEVTFILEG
jgi:flavin-binding protein dodecin